MEWLIIVLFIVFLITNFLIYKKAMATLQAFQAVAARIDAASQRIINNQGINAQQEDALLAQLTAQAEELEAAAEGGVDVPPVDEESE